MMGTMDGSLLRLYDGDISNSNYNLDVSGGGGDYTYYFHGHGRYWFKGLTGTLSFSDKSEIDMTGVKYGTKVKMKWTSNESKN